MKERIPYPALLWVNGKEVAVVGGGRVALHRIEGLLDAGARVRVIAPEADPGIVELVTRGKVKWHKASFSTSMLRGASTVICATDSAEVNRQAAWAAKAMGATVNMAAPPLELGDFLVPAAARCGDLLISVSTGGKCPELSRVLKKETKSLAETFAPWLERLIPIREEAKEKFSSPEEREAFWRDALSDEVTALVKEGRLDEAEARVRDAVNRGGTKS